LQETLFGVFSIAKGYGRKAILFENEFLEMLENNFSKKNK